MADSEEVLNARAALGAELAALRNRAGFTQEALASRMITSRSTIANIETGYQGTSREFWGRADELLDGDGCLLQGFELIEAGKRERHSLKATAAHAAVHAEVDQHGTISQTDTMDLVSRLTLGHTMDDIAPVSSTPNRLTLTSGDVGSGRILTSSGEVIVVAIDRRAFLAGAGLLLPGAALELARHDMHRAFTGDNVAADVSEWQEIVWDHGIDYMRRSPASVLPDLQVDFVALGEALRLTSNESAKRELIRIAALLCSIIAATMANLDDLRSSRRWWRTAKQAADESGDVGAMIWIRGQEIIRSLYERRPLPAILQMITDAESFISGRQVPVESLQKLLAGKAQALSLIGQDDQVESALRQIRDNFDRLPARVTCDTDSIFGWGEHSMRFTESYAYSYLGNFNQADLAQTAALNLYTETHVRGPAQIELQRALCMVRSGDVMPGVAHAEKVMAGVPKEHLNRTVSDIGWRVFSSVPIADRDRTNVQSFHAELESHKHDAA